MPAPPPYPLHWPEGVGRTTKREPSRFKVTLPKAIENMQASLRLFGQDTGQPIGGMVVTSDVAGLMPGSPKDPGVAVWFQWDGGWRCIPVDRYPTVAENVQAIHHVIEAERTKMRHAGIEIVRATFRAFTALPAPRPADDATWWEVLGVTAGATAAEVNAAFKRLYAGVTDPTRQRTLIEARDKALRITGGP